MIRKATQKDVPFIHRLLAQYGQEGLLLARPLTEIYEGLRDFVVAENQAGQLIGVCSLHICWENLCEVRSLAVDSAFKGSGWGRSLVEACLSEATGLGFAQIFVLTYVPGFFERLGFSQIEKSVLPNKIWADCIKCVKFPDCDEVALKLEI